MGEVLALIHTSPKDGALAVWSLLFAVWWRITLVMLVIGILDYLFQRWQHRRDLMMSQYEARQEMKQLEGDPQIRQRIRTIQRQMAMQRMMREVPEADVIITNPTTYAVAIRYDPVNMTSPTVTAKGARLVAERMRILAAENGVPIVERPELARTLYRTLEIGHTIPGDLFRTVAEVLAYVYQIDRRQSKIEERRAANMAPAMIV
jgi:flagellar biosynthetic protein FlhB